MRKRDTNRVLAGLQAGYLVATGAWPFLHRASFERLTGSKKEFWLVRTVGGLAVTCGLALGSTVIRGRASREARLIAGGQAIVFGIADLYASARFSRWYLGDLAFQAICTPAWFRPWVKELERPDDVDGS